MANGLTRYSRPMGALSLGEAMDQLFRETFTWPRLGTAPVGSSFGLNSNLYETGDSYVMQAALPGVKLDELQITANRNVLTLQGKTEIAAPEGARGLWTGLGGGEFREQVTLPAEIDGDKATAEYHDGILTLTLPKAEHARVKTIKVGAASAPAIEGAQE